jgi:hypothetical protein
MMTLRKSPEVLVERDRGRKELAAVSMRKFPATMDADRVAANLHLDAQNDGSEPIVIQTVERI